MKDFTDVISYKLEQPRRRNQKIEVPHPKATTAGAKAGQAEKLKKPKKLGKQQNKMASLPEQENRGLEIPTSVVMEPKTVGKATPAGLKMDMIKTPMSVEPTETPAPLIAAPTVPFTGLGLPSAISDAQFSITPATGIVRQPAEKQPVPAVPIISTGPHFQIPETAAVHSRAISERRAIDDKAPMAPLSGTAAQLPPKPKLPKRGMRTLLDSSGSSACRAAQPVWPALSGVHKQDPIAGGGFTCPPLFKPSPQERAPMNKPLVSRNPIPSGATFFAKERQLLQLLSKVESRMDRKRLGDDDMVHEQHKRRYTVSPALLRACQLLENTQ